MVCRRSPLSLALVVSALLAFTGPPLPVSSFTPSQVVLPNTRRAAAPSLGRRCKVISAANDIIMQSPTTTTSTTTLSVKKKSLSDENYSTSAPETAKRNAETYGMANGQVILLIAMIFNVWIFSIPVEFRRAKFCTEEDVRLNPDSHCTTFGMWRAGIADYYANGGGVNFDFSVEGRE